MQSSQSVLIVEDEAVMALLLEKRIKSKGFSVCGTAATKDEAVSMALENSPDFILMDIRLSGEQDGIDAAQEISMKIKTQIIFVTGYSDERVVNRAMRLHPLAYLVKPVDVSEVVSIMNLHGLE